MILNLLNGYPDRVGKRFTYAGWGLGPTSYSQTTSDPIALPGYQHYIDSMHVSPSVSGTFYARSIPSGKGPRATFKIKYYVASTNAEVANAVNLSAEIFNVSGLGGTY